MKLQNRATARQLVEEYLLHHLTREVTRSSTRYHLHQLLLLFGGWQARRVGPAQMRIFLEAQRGPSSCPSGWRGSKE